MSTEDEERNINDFLKAYESTNFAMYVYNIIWDEFNHLEPENETKKAIAILRFGRFHVTYFITQAGINLSKKGKTKFSLTTQGARDLFSKVDPKDIFEKIYSSWHLSEEEIRKWEKEKNEVPIEGDMDDYLELWESNKFKKDKDLEAIYQEIIKELENFLDHLYNG